MCEAFLTDCGGYQDVDLTPAVQLDACGLKSGGPMSESMIRFAAYSSVLIGGAQALWWEGSKLASSLMLPAIDVCMGGPF